MFDSKKLVLFLAIAAIPVAAIAQDREEEIEAEKRRAEERVEIQVRAVEEQRRMAEKQMEEAAKMHQEAMRARERAGRSAEVEVRMREAEQALAAAAAQMAELSVRRLPRIQTVERIVRADDRPALGITVGASSNGEPVEGVEIIAVTPGGAAAEVGLRSGDVITSVNDEPMSAENSDEAADKLLDFMAGVEQGDVLAVEYLRDGNVTTVELEPRPVQFGTFSFSFDRDDFVAPDVHVVPPVAGVNRFVWITGSSGFGDMELVKLTPELGRYFGADEGLLVVRAPENEDLKLQDGDVIRNIDGRTPTSASHAMRILGSYESGETLKMEIMRDKRREELAIEIPENEAPFPPQVAPPASAIEVLPRREVH